MNGASAAPGLSRKKHSAYQCPRCLAVTICSSSTDPNGAQALIRCSPTAPTSRQGCHVALAGIVVGCARARAFSMVAFSKAQGAGDGVGTSVNVGRNGAGGRCVVEQREPHQWPAPCHGRNRIGALTGPPAPHNTMAQCPFSRSVTVAGASVRRPNQGWPSSGCVTTR